METYTNNEAISSGEAIANTGILATSASAVMESSPKSQLSMHTQSTTSPVLQEDSHNAAPDHGPFCADANLDSSAQEAQFGVWDTRNPETPHDKRASNRVRKVSRACDYCKYRKGKCSGHQPCSRCVTKGQVCSYSARYTRGRPPTPPASIPLSQRINTWAPSASTAAETVANDEGDLGRINHHRRQSRLSEIESASASSHYIGASAPPYQEHDPRAGTTVPLEPASPELEVADVQDQISDTTSGMGFLHHAWKRLSAEGACGTPDLIQTSADDQPVTMAGDRPLPEEGAAVLLRLPSAAGCRRLLTLYFDVCIATYMFICRSDTECWLTVVERNIEQGRPIHHEVGHARAAIVFSIIAIATIHDGNDSGSPFAQNCPSAVTRGDELFIVASRLVADEKGFPGLESVQARLVQVLYLMMTSRFNKCWYTFGSMFSVISTLGLHKRARSGNRRVFQPDDAGYAQTQWRLRTFWSAYILDVYLSVIFGRPRHFHDDDINQDLPDRVGETNMMGNGPIHATEASNDCQIDALIYHAKYGPPRNTFPGPLQEVLHSFWLIYLSHRIAQIIGSISHDVYSPNDVSERSRIAAAHGLIQRVHDWRLSLPAHLGTIKPSMLSEKYRRQATVLRIAYSHAIMHASRPFLLRANPGGAMSTYRRNAEDCINAAWGLLETVDELAHGSSVFRAFTWTQYVTFCALVIVYVWEIRQRQSQTLIETTVEEPCSELLHLADRCRQHLAQATAANSPSRRYAAILDELRSKSKRQTARLEGLMGSGLALQDPRISNNQQVCGLAGTDAPIVEIPDDLAARVDGFDLDDLDEHPTELGFLDDWQTTDWLELDSSAFQPALDLSHCTFLNMDGI